MRTARDVALLFAIALPLTGVAQEPDFALPESSDIPVDVVEPLPAASVDDDRVWEDISYGTGEALFTAIAVDPENPKRLYAGANGAVYVSDDGGVTWLRALRIRGSTSTRAASQAEDSDKTIEDEVSDRIDDARDDLLEELKQQITDDLVAELGSYGEVLADELAEELAEQQLADQEDELADEVRDELSLQAPSGPKSDEELALGVSAQQIEPRVVHRIVALPKGRVLVASGSGLFESKDHGQTFEEFHFGVVPAERDVRSVAVHPLRPNVILAGTLQGLFSTDDAGESWQEVTGFPGKIAFNDLAIDPGQPMRFLAGTDVGVWRSEDGGSTFVAVSQPTSPLAQFTRAVAFDPVDPRITFAGTQEGLFRSLDGGEEWERLEPPGLLTRDVQDFASKEWGLIASSSNGVFMSADSGESFRELYAGLDTQDVRRLAASETPLEAYAATGRGLFAYRAPEARARKLKALSDIRELLSREPPIDEVAREAMSYAAVDLPVASWRSRAALAPLAPRLTVRWNGVDPLPGPFDRRASGTTFPPTLYDFIQRDSGWTAQITWDLFKFFWPQETLSVASTFRRTEKIRARVLRRVVNTYNARRRLQVGLIQNPPADLRSHALKELQVEELSAVLDGLTGGWFTRSLAASPASGQRLK